MQTRRRVRRRETTLQDLPNECVACVLSHLHSKADKDAAALTCRLWRALEASSRHTICFDSNEVLPEQRFYLHRLFPQVLHTFPNMSRLIIRGGLGILFEGVVRFLQGKGFSQLKTLHLYNSKLSYINDTLMSVVALGCPALTHLSLSHSRVTDVGFHSLAHGCMHLVSLNVVCSGITDVGIDAVLKMCPNMMVIYVHEHESIQGWGFRNGKALERLDACEFSMTNAAFDEGLQGATSLRALNLQLRSPWPSLAPIAEYCKLLEVLWLRSFNSLDDLVIQKIAHGCAQLRVLNAEGCNKVTVHGWRALAQSAIKLEDLNVSRCRQFRENSLRAIQNGCPKLRCLGIPRRLSLSHPAVKRFRVSRPAVRLSGIWRSIDSTY